MSAPILAFYREHHRALLGYLRRRFPVLDEASVHDAVQDAFLDALCKPEAFDRAHQKGGDAELARLVRCVAWRKARGELRQWRSVVRGAQPAASCPPGQLHGQALYRLRELIDRAVDRFGHSKRTELRRALEHKLWSGEPDRQVAREFQIPREYLNRAKRFVQDALLFPC